MKSGFQWKAVIVSLAHKPPFRLISPLVYFSSWSFGVMNLFFFSPTFVFADGSKGLILVGAVPSVVWGLVFISLGSSMIYGLLANKWIVIKSVLGAGLFVKALFAWGLIFTFFIHPESLAIIGLWFGIMVWQGLCIIYFTPGINREPNL